MDSDKLIQNIIDQIKEAQIKLGYVKETVRLYYPVASMNMLLGTNAGSGGELLTLLEKDNHFSSAKLGKIQFAAHKDRIEVNIPPEGAAYVYREVESPAFLTELIDLFGRHHSCTLEDICGVFEKYSKDYVCEKMPEGMDFEYALHFMDSEIDGYYYCIKEEMGHTIYHRFTKADYLALID